MHFLTQMAASSQANKNTSILRQGSQFSDFFPTPRTILEISVNLKRKFVLKGRGRGIRVQWPKWHWNTPFATREANTFLREDPQTPPGIKTGFCQKLWKTCGASATVGWRFYTSTYLSVMYCWRLGAWLQGPGFDSRSGKPPTIKSVQFATN